MSDTYLSNNSGERSSPTPESSQPKVTQTTQVLTGTAGTNYPITVKAGQRYRVTAQLPVAQGTFGGFVFGLATVATGSEANIRWCCPTCRSIEITIPAGNTTLHYSPDTTGAIGYIVELK